MIGSSRPTADLLPDSVASPEISKMVNPFRVVLWLAVDEAMHGLELVV